MQDFFKQQAEWLKTWQENQEKLTKQYVETGEAWAGNMFGDKDKESNIFEGWYRSQSDLEGQFREFSKRLNETITQLWGGKIPSEVLKFMNISFFEEFYKNWLSNLEMPGGVKNPLGMDGGWQQATKFLRSLMEQQNPFFSSFGNTNILNQMSRNFGILQGAFGQEGNAFGNMLSGYQDIFSKLFDSSTAQGTEKLAENFETWAKEMEKQLLTPKFGINRELVHDIAQALVMSQKYVQAYLKMARLVETTSRKAGIRFQTKLSESALKKEPVTNFSDICALWAAENETLFLEVMGSQEYAKLQGDFVDAGHRLKIQWNKLAEKALEATPIALKRDLDLAIAEIHQLKRTMRNIQRELRATANETRIAREAQKAAEEETEKARAAVKAAEAAAQEEVRLARKAQNAAEEEAKQTKAAAKAAEAAAQEEARLAREAQNAAEEEAKQAKAAAKAAEAAAKEGAPKAKTAATTTGAATQKRTSKTTTATKAAGTTSQRRTRKTKTTEPQADVVSAEKKATSAATAKTKSKTA